MLEMSSFVLAALVVTGAAGQALMAYWPDLRGWPETITSRSAALDTPVVPPGWAFAIWGPIFLSCAGFAVFFVLEQGWSNPALRTIGWWAALLFGLNVHWEAYVPRRDLDWPSVAIIAAEFVVSIVLVFLTRAADLTGWDWWLVAFPLQLFAGWVSVACFVNLSSTLRLARERRTGSARLPSTLSAGLIVCAGTVACAVAVATGAWPYAASATWGLGMIAARSQSPRTVRALAATAAALVIGAVVVSPSAEASAPLINHSQRSDTMPADHQTELLEQETVRAGTLDIAYLRRGPDSPPQVVFVHGFPDDASAWLPVMDALAERGVPSAAPYLRGFGQTRFTDADAVRSGQLAALVSDLTAFLDAVGSERVTLVGHDWGARAAQGVAALHPERVEQLVSFGGYAVSFGEEGPPPYEVLEVLWYQHLLNMPFAEGLLHGDTEGFARHLWKVWSPRWEAEARDAAFEQARAAFQNPDFVPVVLSAYSYTERGYDESLAELEARLAQAPEIDVPTVILRGGTDPLETPEAFADDAAKFTQIEARRTLSDAGHFVHRERPDVLVELLLQ